MNPSNHAGDELADIEREFRAFDRLPKAVREAVNAAPHKIAATALARNHKNQAAMLAAIARGNSRTVACAGMYD